LRNLVSPFLGGLGPRALTVGAQLGSIGTSLRLIRTLALAVELSAKHVQGLRYQYDSRG